MDTSNAYAIAALIAVAGFLIGRWDAKPVVAAGAAVVAAAPQAPVGPAASPEVAVAPEQAAPAAPAPEPEPAARPAPTTLNSQSDEGAGKGVDVAKVGHSPNKGPAWMGSKDAVVLMTIFSDFQCPVCRRSADPIKQLVADFPGDVKVVFRNNALAMHGRSQPSAVAAAAAQKQGKFWQYHDKLFETGQLDDQSLLDHARTLGLDMARFQSDLADGRLVERMTKEAKMSEKLGASGTPAFFVNGVRQVGWGSYMALKSMVAREIAQGKELLAGGVQKKDVIRKRIEAGANSNSKDEGETHLDGKLWASLLLSDL